MLQFCNIFQTRHDYFHNQWLLKTILSLMVRRATGSVLHCVLYKTMFLFRITMDGFCFYSFKVGKHGVIWYWLNMQCCVFFIQWTIVSIYLQQSEASQSHYFDICFSYSKEDDSSSRSRKMVVVQINSSLSMFQNNICFADNISTDMLPVKLPLWWCT